MISTPPASSSAICVCHLRDGAEDHGLDRWRPLPIVGVGLQHNLLAFGPGHELIWPGTHRFFRESAIADLLGIGRWDHLKIGQALRHNGVRLFGDQTHGVIIDYVHPGDPAMLPRWGDFWSGFSTRSKLYFTVAALKGSPL